MTVKELRELLEEWKKLEPSVDAAELQINLGHSIEGVSGVHHFIQKNLVVLFPVSVPGRVKMPTREEFERIQRRQAEGQ